MNHDTAKIRQFLTQHFNDQEFNTLCFDYFLDVYHDFTDGMTKTQKIQLLLDHCIRQGRLENLMVTLKKERPNLFPAFFPTFDHPETASSGPQRLAFIQRDPHRIFIGHAHQDVDFAQRLAADLQSHSWSVWIAPNSIHPGEKWVDAINRGLEESGIFVLVLTESAVNSRWVRSETNIAVQWEHQGKMRFIPLKIDSDPIQTMPALWSGYQQILFHGSYQSGFQAMLEELQSEVKVSLRRSAPTHLEKGNWLLRLQDEAIRWRARLRQISTWTTNWLWYGVVLIPLLIFIWSIANSSFLGEGSATPGTSVADLSTTPSDESEEVKTPTIPGTTVAQATSTRTPPHTASRTATLLSTPVTSKTPTFTRTVIPTNTSMTILPSTPILLETPTLVVVSNRTAVITTLAGDIYRVPADYLRFNWEPGLRFTSNENIPFSEMKGFVSQEVTATVTLLNGNTLVGQIEKETLTIQGPTELDFIELEWRNVASVNFQENTEPIHIPLAWVAAKNEEMVQVPLNSLQFSYTSLAPYAGYVTSYQDTIWLKNGLGVLFREIAQLITNEDDTLTITLVDGSELISVKTRGGDLSAFTQDGRLSLSIANLNQIVIPTDQLLVVASPRTA